MGLFTPKWKSENRYTAVCAVDKCKNQKKLGKIGREAPTLEARQRAVRLLEDQKELYSIALTDNGVSKEAIVKLSDPALLGKLAQTPTLFWTLRQAAAEKLTDQSVLEEIARTDEEDRVRITAMELISDPDRRVEIAMADPKARIHAVKEWVTSQDELIRLGRSDPDAYVRAAAIPRIEDDRIRGELALWNTFVDIDVRIRALDEFCPDDATLEKIILSDTNSAYFRTKAVSRLHDQDALIHVIEHETYHTDVIEAAVNNITDRDKLLTLLGEKKTVKYAMARGRELHMLDDEALSCVHPSAAEKAVLERDRSVFLEKLAAEQDSEPILKAYWNQDVKSLEKNAAPEAVEAIIMLLREYGEEKGEPSALGYNARFALINLWRMGGEERRNAVKEANRWSINKHGDHGSGSCHEDNGPIIFDFKE